MMLNSYWRSGVKSYTLIAIFSLALAAVQASVNIVPSIVETYATPSGDVVFNMEYTSSNTLVLITDYSGLDQRLEFDPVAETFSIQSGFIDFGSGAELIYETLWDSSTETSTMFSTIPNGWADFCNGVYYAGGFGGTDITISGSYYGFNRSIYGMTYDNNGKIIALLGSDLGSPCLSPDYLEVAELEFDSSTQTVTPNLLFDLSPVGTNVQPFYSDYMRLDYDAERDVYWVYDRIDERFLGYDSSGNFLYTVPWPYPSEVPSLVHYQGDFFYLVEGTSTLYLLELDFDTRVSDWMTYQ